jgi:hypothetical protein
MIAVDGSLLGPNAAICTVEGSPDRVMVARR